MKRAHIRISGKGFHAEMTLCWEPPVYQAPCGDDAELCAECLKQRSMIQGWTKFERPRDVIERRTRLVHARPRRPKAPEPEWIKDGTVPRPANVTKYY